MNASEPLTTCRESVPVAKTGIAGSARDLGMADTCLPAMWQPSLRWHDLTAGSFTELGKSIYAVERPSKWRPHKANSEAYMDGGQTHSSDKAAVMAVERRGLAMQSSTSPQLAIGGWAGR